MLIMIQRKFWYILGTYVVHTILVGEQIKNKECSISNSYKGYEAETFYYT